MNNTDSTQWRNIRPIKCVDVSYIPWKSLALLVFICVFCIIVCFAPYPGSNGESMLQHLISGQGGEYHDEISMPDMLFSSCRQTFGIQE